MLTLKSPPPIDIGDEKRDELLASPPAAPTLWDCFSGVEVRHAADRREDRPRVLKLWW